MSEGNTEVVFIVSDSFEFNKTFAMRIEEKSYTLEERRSLDGICFHFESNGKNKVRKAVEYAVVMQFDGRDVYNLGFGDYNSDADGFFDNICTNNGDVYTVFNTVLNSIP